MVIIKDLTEYIWIGCDSSTESCTGKGLLYGICGQASYCNDESKVSVNTTHKQCTLGRGGIACGTCLPNNSLQLGSSQCRLCTNSYLGYCICLLLLHLFFWHSYPYWTLPCRMVPFIVFCVMLASYSLFMLCCCDTIPYTIEGTLY